MSAEPHTARDSDQLERERKQAILQMVLDNVPAQIAYYDARTIECVFANETYAKANGKTVAWALGQHCRDIIGEAAWAQIAGPVQRVIAGETIGYERTLVLPSGQERRIEVNLIPHHLEDGEQVGAFVLIHDITRHYAAEQSVRDSEERLRKFAAATGEAIIFHKGGVIEDGNQALATMVGLPLDQLLGRNLLDFLPPAQRTIAAGNIAAGLERTYETQVITASGAVLPIETISKVMQFGDKELRLVVARDVSERHQLLANLANSQRQYQALVDNSYEAVFVAQDAVLHYANPTASRLFDRPIDQLVGLPSLHLIHPDDREHVISKRLAMLAGQTLEPYEARLLSPPGPALAEHHATVWAQIYGVKIEWNDQPALLILITDISQRKAAEAETLAALAREKDLGELKTRFVSMASHEFRTPLSTIQTSTELLVHYNDRLSTEERAATLKDIQQSVDRMKALMENFLAFGRMDGALTQCKRAPCLVLELLHQIASEAMSADGHRHALQMQAIETLAPVTAPATLELDAALLRQIVGNLLTNACKYSQTGKTVHLRWGDDETPQGHFLVLQVQDEGIGIPPHDVPRLFETFHRASNVEHIPGTGLGLAIVKRAIDAHGGSIDVHSAMGEGSRFEVRIPF